MKKITIISSIVILIFNLIVNNKVYAEYPDVIDDSIERESLEQIEESIDPNITNNLSDEGKVDVHYGSYVEGSNEYPISDETTTVNSTISSSGSGATIMAQLINLFPTTINAIMTLMVLGQEPDGTAMEEFTIQNLVYNNYRLFDINIFDIDSSSTDANNSLKRDVAKWYVAIRSLAIVVSLCILIYIGIRMAISTTANKKAAYKQMFIDWVVGFILIFLMQYIIAVAMFTSKSFLELLPEETENLETVIMEGNGSRKGIEEQMEESKGWNFATACVLYWLMVYYQIKFMILYLKRLLSTMILTVISPLVCAIYPIDKIKDKKAQSYKNWFKEIMVNIYIQPIHAIIYIVFIASAAEIAKEAPLFAIIFLAALSRGEKIVKNIFNIRGLSSINSLGTIKLGGK